MSFLPKALSHMAQTWLILPLCWVLTCLAQLVLCVNTAGHSGQLKLGPGSMVVEAAAGVEVEVAVVADIVAVAVVADIAAVRVALKAIIVMT